MTYKIKADFDPQTPLRVDMRGATEEDHRKVQEIFFALGYFWLSQHGESPRTYPPHPELNYYTNYNITQPGKYLRWLSKNKHNLPTLTPQEFYDLVLEATLNLTKEHERKRFKTRRGNPVIIVHVETELDVTHPVIGYELFEGRWTLATWYLTGKCFRESESALDIVEEYTPVFEHWDMLSTSIVAIAKNANGNGSWYGFTEVPQKDNYRWSPGGGSHFPLCFLNVQFPECDWEDSLIVRPEEN